MLDTKSQRNLDDSPPDQAELLPPKFANSGSTSRESLLIMARDFEDQMNERYKTSYLKHLLDYKFECPIKLLETSTRTDCAAILLDNNKLFLIRELEAKFNNPITNIPKDITAMVFVDGEKLLLGTKQGKLLLYDYENYLPRESIDLECEIKMIHYYAYTLVKEGSETPNIQHFAFVQTVKGIIILNAENLIVRRDVMNALPKNIMSEALKVKVNISNGTIAILTKNKSLDRLNFFSNIDTLHTHIGVTLPDPIVDFNFKDDKGLVILNEKELWIIDDYAKVFKDKGEIEYQSSPDEPVGKTFERRKCQQNFIIDGEVMVYRGDDQRIYENNLFEIDLFDEQKTWGQLSWNEECHELKKLPNSSSYVFYHESTLKIIQLTKSRRIDTLGYHDNIVTSVTITHDCKLVISGSEDKSIKLWSSEAKKVIYHFEEAHRGNITDLVVSSDGKFLYTGSADQSLKVWNLETFEVVQQIPNAHSDSVMSLALSEPNGVLISGSADRAIKFWDVDDKRLIHEISPAHDDLIYCVKVSADGDWLVSAGRDGVIKVWDIVKRELLFKFEDAHEDGVTTIALSRDRRFLLSGSSDRTIKLWDLTKRRLIYQFDKAHDKAISTLSFSQDDKYIFSGSRDCSIKAWSMQTKQLSFHLNDAHLNDVTSLAVSSDGKFLVSGSKDVTLKLWNIETRYPMHTFDQPLTGTTYTVVISQDGKYLVSGSQDHSIRLWSVQMKQLLYRFENAHKDEVRTVAISNDSKLIASGSSDKDLKIWSVEDRRLLHLIGRAHEDTILSVAFSHDGKRVVTGSEDCMVKVWDVIEGKLLHTFKRAHQDSVSSVVVTKNDEWIVSGSHDLSFKVWNMKSYELVYEFGHVHEKKIKSLGVSSDGEFCVTASDDGGIKLWSLRTRQLVHHYENAHEEDINSIAISNDSKMIISASRDKSIRIWSTETKQLMHCFSLAHDKSIYSVAISQNQDYIVSSSMDETIKLWPIDTKTPNQHFFKSHENSVTALAISSNNKYVISGSADYSIKVWNIEKNQLVHHFENAHEKRICSISIAGYSKYFVSGSFDESIKLWSLETRQLIHDFVGAHTNSVTSVSISHDGKFIISGSADNSIKIWEVESKTLYHHFENAHEDTVTSVVVSRNYDWFVSGSEDRNIKVWSLKTKSLLLTIDDTHDEGVSSVDITSDSKQIVSGSYDKSIKIWDAITGKLNHQFEMAHDEDITSIGVSADGRFIVSGSSDKSIRLWDLNNKVQINHFERAHDENVRIVAISNDGEIIVSGSDDTKIKVWNQTNSTMFTLSDIVTPKKGQIDNISVYLPGVFSFFGLRRPYLRLIREFYISNHGWNAFHYHAIKNPSYMVELNNKDKKIHSFLDNYGKTPLHYLIAQGSTKYLYSINHTFEIMLEFLEENKTKNQYIFNKTMESLQGIMNYLLPKVFPATNIQRFLNLCIGDLQISHGQVLNLYGDIVKSNGLFNDAPLLDDKNNVDDIFTEDGTHKIRFRSTLLPMDFSIRSDSALSFLNLLKKEKRRFIYESQFVSKIVETYWSSAKKIQLFLMLVYSSLMILFTIEATQTVDIEVSLLRLLILIMAGVLIVYEIMKICLRGTKDKFKEGWRITDIICLFLVISSIILKMIDFEALEDSDLVPWMQTIGLLFGYYRWISYLRVFDSVRNLYRLVENIIVDMKGFIIVVVVLIFAFFAVLMSFEFGENTMFENFYISYMFLFTPLSGELSASEKLIAMMFSFVLNVLFINLLISLMADTFDKTQERGKFSDNKDKIDMIYESCLVSRLFFKPPERDLKYLIYCEYEDDEKEERWDGRINLLKRSIHETQEKIIQNSKKIEKTLNDKLESQGKHIEEKIDMSLKKRHDVADSATNRENLRLSIGKFDSRMSMSRGPEDLETKFLNLSRRLESAEENNFERFNEVFNRHDIHNKVIEEKFENLHTKIETHEKKIEDKLRTITKYLDGSKPGLLNSPKAKEDLDTKFNNIEKAFDAKFSTLEAKILAQESKLNEHLEKNQKSLNDIFNLISQLNTE